MIARLACRKNLSLNEQAKLCALRDIYAEL